MDYEPSDAVLLLQATRRLHEQRHPNARLRPGDPVAPQDACGFLGCGIHAPRCDAALEQLEAEGALERSPIYEKALGTPPYVWGERAWEMLGEE